MPDTASRKTVLYIAFIFILFQVLRAEIFKFPPGLVASYAARNTKPSSNQ